MKTAKQTTKKTVYLAILMDCECQMQQKRKMPWYSNTLVLQVSSYCCLTLNDRINSIQWGFIITKLLDRESDRYFIPIIQSHY